MSDKESAIEQIAKDIFISDNSNSQDPEKEWDNALAADRGYARYIARGLHSLGYTSSVVHQCCVDAEAAKHRTIETARELNDLPDGSAILDNQGDVAQKLNGWWHFPETAPMGSSKVVKYGAVTVLYTPEPQP